MRFSFDKAIGIHEQALNVYAKRVQVLATNIANADTPNFKARDVDFKAVLSTEHDKLSANNVKRTHSQHLSGSMNNLNGVPVMYRSVEQPSLDGNTVDAQHERAEFAQNALRYQAAISFLERRFKGMINAFKGE